MSDEELYTREEPIDYYTKCGCCGKTIKRSLSKTFYTDRDLSAIIQGRMGTFSVRDCETCDLMTWQQTVGFKWPFDGIAL